ncbi:MAG: UvrD-helicase domain-containing protein [Dehalococcoidia bacterium]
MSTAFVPADQAIRDEIAERVDTNMIVEAGAGTGKTTVLVERIVRIIATGHAAVHELAVITFTEKAAAELSARVRQGFEDALADVATAPVERTRLEAAIRGLNHAHIETIHAFASGLLRERPVEADLDPGFEVLDTLPAQLEFDAAWSDWLTAQTGGDDPPEALVNVLNLQLDFKLVRDAAQHLNEHRDLLPLRPYPKRHVDAIAVLDAVRLQIDVLRASKQHCIDVGDYGYQQIERLEADLHDLDGFRGYPDALRRALVSLDSVNPKSGAQPKWRTKSDLASVKACFGVVSKLLEGAKSDMREAAVADLLEWLQGFVFFYDERRRKAGKADFDDLLVWARDLVRDNAEVRAYFQQKYRCVLVDEFQDTDPLQVELIVLLCAEGAAIDWRRAKLREGSLFVVGDPKQSIYRFRRADIAMYDDVKRHVFGGAPVRITQNFRSVDGVIGWVNDTFDELFEETPGVQPPYVPLSHHPEYISEDAITLVGGTAAGSKASDVRLAEAEAIASLVRERVAGGGWRVREGKAAQPQRPARFGDIVVLIPSRTELVIYEEAFARAGVPYRHEGGRTFFTRQEVRELVAVLRAIDDPADGVATVAALRSAAFGCSDEDLLLHKVNGGRFDFISMDDKWSGPVAESLHTLRRLARKRHAWTDANGVKRSPLTLSELVRAVLDATRLVEFAMLQPQGEQVAANLLKVIDQARTYAEASGGGLRGFVRWLKENVTRTTDETDAPISEETDDVVRIVTVHAAKGLEFPIVVFANMGTRRYDYTRVIADRGARALHMRLGRKDLRFQTPGFAEAEDAEKGHASAEELRLLYVASTRAKDRLVVPFIDAADAKIPKVPECLNDWLRKENAGFAPSIDAATLPRLVAALPVWRREPAAVPDGAPERVIAARAQWLAEHDALVERAKRPLVVRTASALKPEWERPLAATDDVRRGNATEFGSAVHALLERIELRSTDEIDVLARAIASESGMPQRADEIATIARRALASAVVERALRSRRMLLEAPFTVALPRDAATRAGLPEGLAEGRIDLLFEEDSAAVIVDFKTDAVTEKDVDERAAHYRNQALVYAWAVRQAAMPVREVVFLFARPGVERAYPVDDAFLAEAEALMRLEPVPEEALA